MPSHAPAPSPNPSPLSNVTARPLSTRHPRAATAEEAESADTVMRSLTPPPPNIPGAAPFSVPLGIGLASASFESYNSYMGHKADLAHVDAAGAVTAYVSAPTLAAGVGAALRVTLVSGANLPSADMLGKSDPYVVLGLGSSSHRSAVVGGTVDPTWGEAFTLYTPPGDDGGAGTSTATLTLTVLDQDKLSKDDVLGTAELRLDDLAGDGDVTLPLTLAEGMKASGGEGAAASITLRLARQPLTPAFLTDATAGELGSAVDSEDVARMGAAWRELARVSGDIAADLFDPVAFIDHPATDTQLWVGANFERRALGMAFRGTEMDKIMDVLTDLNALPTEFNPEEALPAEVRATKKAGPIPYTKDVWTHSGFTGAYRAVHGAAFRVLTEAMRAADAQAGGSAPGKPWTLYFCGHSLGGALATLGAYEAAHTAFADGTVKKIMLYNYGSPRVGSAAFKAAFDAAIPDAWRVINAADIIPRVPRLLGYAHVGHVVCLNRDGTFDLDHKDDALFEEGSGSLDAAKVIASKVVEGREAVMETVSEEWNLAKGVVSGEALQDHRESMYMETLRAVIEGREGGEGAEARAARADAALGKAEA